jgi:hypothetical protein
MIRKIFGLTVIAVFMISCGNSGNKANVATAGNDEVAVVEFASLTGNPSEFENRDITVSGKVVHVCTMSGKKMFIVGEDPDIRLFITAGDDIPKFPMELLGSEITVTGTLAVVEPGEKMGEGEGAMKEGEGAMHAAEVSDAEQTGEACETEEALANQVVLADYVLHYKSHQVK